MQSTSPVHSPFHCCQLKLRAELGGRVSLRFREVERVDERTFGKQVVLYHPTCTPCLTSAAIASALREPCAGATQITSPCNCQSASGIKCAVTPSIDSPHARYAIHQEKWPMNRNTTIVDVASDAEHLATSGTARVTWRLEVECFKEYRAHLP